jgi:hypothetical protein
MQAGPDVLRVSATISELDLSTAPAVGGTQRVHVVSPQDLTLLMELRDSQSGALLARAIDRDKGRAIGNLQVEGDLKEFYRGAQGAGNVSRPAAWRARCRAHRARGGSLTSRFESSNYPG